MTSLAYCGWPATMRRLAAALAVSTLGHAAVLANAAFTPGPGDMTMLGAARPLAARLVPAPAPPRDDTPAPEAQAADPQAKASGLPSHEIYFRASEVDERALPVEQVDVEYPAQALADRVSGVVTLRLLIDHDGFLRDASVVESRPAGVFEKAALEAVHRLRFRPAMRNGAAVGSVKLIEVPFEPDCRRTGSCIE